MRAFFCFFFALFWVLCAQEKPDFEKFKADYDLMKKEVGDAKERTIMVDFKWIEDHSQHLQKMVGIREWLIQNSLSPVDREAASNIDLQPLIDDLVFAGRRLLVEKNVQDENYTLERVEKTELLLLSQELNRFEQNRASKAQPEQMGFSMGLQELNRPSKILWDLGIIELVLADPEFVSRVCKDMEGCVDRIAVLRKKVTADQVRAKLWMEKAKTWQPSPSVAPPLPEVQSKKPG